MSLTIKQQKFADEYIELGNGTQAAVAAGYSKKTARKIANNNLNHPVIKAYIKDRLAEIQSKKIADQTEVMEYLTRVMRGEETETVVTPKGIVIDDVSPKTSDKNKAAELIGKRHQMWTDNVNLTGSDIKITIGGDDDDN